MSILNIACIDSSNNLIKYVKDNIPKGKKITITGHNYSLNNNNVSHNEKISRDKMLTSDELNKLFPNNEVIIINQSSKINNCNVSRGTGIKVSKKGELHPNKYDDTFEKEENELVNKILKYPLFSQFIVDNAKTTPLRTDKEGNKFHASFLHDVKALYLSQNHIELMNNEVLIPHNIWSNNRLYTNYKLDYESEYMGVHFLVNTDKLHEYNQGFNKWLDDVLSGKEFIVHIDGISTDPFFGYKSSDGVYHTDIAQDLDDACVLWLFENCSLPSKQQIPLIVSDEFVVFSEENQKYEGLRTEEIKKNFSKFDIIDDLAVINYTKRFDWGQVGDWNFDRFIETIDGPVIDPKAISHYRDFFGIYQRVGNTVTLKPKDERKNGFQDDQVTGFFSRLLENKDANDYTDISNSEMLFALENIEFTIVRNANNRGGTPYANPNESGYKDPELPYEKGDSMSKYHQFIIINNLLYWWSNCAFFGKGPGKYGTKGSLILCYKLRELAKKWAIKHDIKNPIFCFHEHPNNSLPSLHLHLLDGDNLNEIPWKEHSYKNVSLDAIIKRLESKLIYEDTLEKVLYNWMPIMIALLSALFFYTLR